MSLLASVALAAPQECGGDVPWFSSWTTPGCTEPDSIATQVIKGSIFEPWVNDVRQGVGDAVKTMITFWLSVPDPNVGDVTGAKAEVISFISDRLVWLSAIIMCFVVAFQLMRMMWEQNGAPLKKIAHMILAYLVTGALAIPAVAVGLLITSALAAGILDAATIGPSFSDNLFSLFNSNEGVASGILLIFLLVIAMLLACVQCIIMIGRGGALFIILAVLQVQAAAVATDSGGEGYKTSIGWIEGLGLYKLTAAIIYGIGFKFLSSDLGQSGTGILQILYGLTILFMAIFSLPATMRLTAPATTPVASGSGAGAAAAGAAPAVVAAGMRH